MNTEQQTQQPLTTMLFTNARDETCLIEWIVHHLQLGFTHIHIFDHLSIVPIQFALQEFLCSPFVCGKVTVQRVDWTTTVKIKCMMTAVYIANDLAQHSKVDWIMYLDADEFVVLNNNTSVSDLLLKQSKLCPFARSFAVNWLCFGTNELRDVPEWPYLIVDTYTRSAKTLDKHVKSFVRPEFIVQVSNPHFYHVTPPSHDNTGMYSIEGFLLLHSEQGEYYYCPHLAHTTCEEVTAFIAHYIHQAESRYKQRKLDLPRDDTNEVRACEADVHALYNDIENHHVQQKYACTLRQLFGMPT